jgi:hypothetical protein
MECQAMNRNNNNILRIAPDLIATPIAFANKFLFSVPLLVIFLISGCASGPTIHNNQINASHEIAAPASVNKANVGIFFDPSLASYIHMQSISDSMATMNVGQESVALFRTAIPKVFESTKLINKLPPYDIPNSELDGIVEPRLDYVNWRMFFDSQQEFFHVEYTFIFYTAEGVPISIWTIKGVGEQLKHQLADAAQKFVTGFDTAPETKRFRQYLEDKQVGKPGFDGNNIKIEASLAEEIESGIKLKELGILPVQITVKNETSGDITGRGFDVRLIYADGKRLVPAFPLALVSALEYKAAQDATDPAMVGAFFGTFGMMGTMFGAHSDRVKVRKNQTAYFEKTRLKEVTLARGESIQGTLYFVLPPAVTQLDEAALSFWFIDPSVANGVRKTISLSGIDFKQVKGAAGSNASSAQGMVTTTALGIMTTTDMKNVVSGNTESGDTKGSRADNSYKFHIYYNPNGTMLGRSTSKTNTEYEDSGAWEILDSGQICATWKKWLDHKQYCYLMEALGGGRYRSTAVGKSYESIVEFRKGDPEGLAGEIAAPLTQTPPDFNITGTYIANVTREDNSDYFCFNQKKTFQIELKQENDIINGKFLSGISGGIEGAMAGNKVKFNWYTARCSNLIEGEWTVSSDGSSLEGYGWSELKWRAQKQF